MGRTIRTLTLYPPPLGGEDSLIRVRNCKPAQAKVVTEAESSNRPEVINIDDEDNKVPLRMMLSKSRVLLLCPLSNTISISFAEPNSKLKDEDLEDKEFQMNEIRPSSGTVEGIIRDEDLNIDWIDDDSVDGVDDNKVEVHNDENKFSSESELS